MVRARKGVIVKGGESCIGTLHLVNVNKYGEGERSNDIYVLGVFLVFLVFSSRGVGRLPNQPKMRHNFFG